MRIVLGSYLVRYPLGGNISCVLQYLAGLCTLGHDVYFVEKSGYANSCYDPTTNTMGNDCSYGLATVRHELQRIEMQDRICYVDQDGVYHGIARERIEEIFRSADLFIEMGTHEAWVEEASWASRSVIIDGDPGFTHIWMTQRIRRGERLPHYDAYFTVGSRVANGKSPAPNGGVHWNHIFHPVATDLFRECDVLADAPYTTVMNWQSYSTVEFEGVTYGHKNIEFEKFMDLPLLADSPVEAAISGHHIPRDRLLHNGWRLQNGHDVTQSVDRFAEYIAASRGEFTVCKNGFVALETGWFGDRSSAYLASGRPVVAQDTGFGEQLPCGSGLFAIADSTEAAEAMRSIERDYVAHSRAARQIAKEFLEARKVMRSMLESIS